MLKVKVFIDEYIRPRVQGDGGEIMFEKLEENNLTLVLMGECADCSKNCNMSQWIKSVLKDKFNKNFNITLKSKRQYFTDV